MSLIAVFFLGILQGITEFLPVSSFGHLTIAESFLGTERAAGVLLETILHLGTSLSIIFMMKNEFIQLAGAFAGMALDLVGNLSLYFYNRRNNEQLRYAKIVTGTYRRLCCMVIVSMIPTCLLGRSCQRLVTRAAISPFIPGACMMVTALFLLVTDLSGISGKKVSQSAGYDSALWIGIALGVSVFPGISSFGMCLIAGLLTGLDKRFAIKYTLLLHIPAGLGAFFVELPRFRSPAMSASYAGLCFFGMFIAFVTACLSQKFLIRVSSFVKLRYFAIYCFILGLFTLIRNFA